MLIGRGDCFGRQAVAGQIPVRVARLVESCALPGVGEYRQQIEKRDRLARERVCQPRVRSRQVELARPGTGGVRDAAGETGVDLYLVGHLGCGEKILYYSTRQAAEVPSVLETGFRAIPGEVPTYMGKINHVPSDGPVTLADWHTSLGDGDQLYNVGEPK